RHAPSTRPTYPVPTTAICISLHDTGAASPEQERRPARLRGPTRSDSFKVVEAQRHRDRGVPLALDVRVRPERRDVHRESPAQVEAHARGRIPLAEGVARAASDLHAPDTPLEAGVKRLAAVAMADLYRRRPGVGVVRHVAPIVHGEFDAHVACGNRRRLHEVAVARCEAQERVARLLDAAPVDPVAESTRAKSDFPAIDDGAD